MNFSNVIPPYRPDHPDWVNRKEAARRIDCSPRHIPNLVAKGKVIAHKISAKNFRYYAPQTFYENGEPILPVETYDDARCFILWITFSDESRKDSMAFDKWNSEMSTLIDEYVRDTIRAKVIETFRLRTEREHHNVSMQDPILHFVVKMPGRKMLNLNDRS